MELIFPICKKLFSYIVKMTTPPSNSTDNDPSAGNEGKGDFNKGNGPKGDGSDYVITKKNHKKSKKSKRKIISRDEQDIEETRLNKAFNKYVDFENKHDKKIEIEKTLPSFLDNYSK